MTTHTTIKVKDLAGIVGVEPNNLLERLHQAGIKKTSIEDDVSDEEKYKLLLSISEKKSQPTKKIQINKKSTEQLKVSGQNRKINLEIRKKRKIIKPTEPVVAVMTTQTTPEEQPLQTEVQPISSSQPTANPSTDIQIEQIPVTPSDLLINESLESTKASIETSTKKKTNIKDNIPEPVSEPEEDTFKKKKIKKSKKKSSDFYETDKSSFKQTPYTSKFNKKSSNRMDMQKVETQKFTKPVSPQIKTVILSGDTIAILELAQQLSLKASEIVKILFKMGCMVTLNQSIDTDTAILVIEELDQKYILQNENALEDDLIIERDESKLVTKAPVVTIMGHVDHGKTSLLDCIRNTKITSGESGGITQHIGAYSVNTPKGNITFLDTPGHEAFTAMRIRGATATDLVILVVAADDGVKPQTIEAITHAKAAGAPIIVAVNKIDKPEADLERVKNEVSQHDLIPEDWGGDIMFMPVSAKAGTGIDQLLEAILLQAEVLELQAPAEGPAEGVVIESRMEKGRGVIATILVQKGLLNKGDIILAGAEYGRIRAMTDDMGKQIKSAGPSTPVEIIGLSSAPFAGDQIISVKDEQTAREASEHRREKTKEQKQAQQQSSKLSNVFDQMSNQDQKTLKVIIKADVQGSSEAISESLRKLSTEDVKVDIIATSIGGINNSDITLAQAFGAVVFAFNVRADRMTKDLAEKEGIEIRYYSVIYDLIEDVRLAMSGLLSPEFKEKIVGIAEVRDVFRSSKYGAIAGCMVTEGSVKRNNPIRVLRNQVVIYTGSLESLKRFKDDATEVKKGMECGIGVKNYNDVKSGDQIEVFETIEVRKEI